MLFLYIFEKVTEGFEKLRVYFEDMDAIFAKVDFYSIFF